MRLASISKFKKKFIYLLLIGCIFLLTIKAMQNANALAGVHAIQPDFPAIQFDIEKMSDLPKNFRTVQTNFREDRVININKQANQQDQMSKADPKSLPSRLGLFNLNMSGSGQFSVMQLQNLIKELGIRQGYVVDLRQESHGFLDDTPIYWYNDRNAENKNKKDKEIKRLEKQLLNSLRQSPNLLVYQRIHLKNGEKVFKPWKITFQKIGTEKQIVNESGLKYKRFYVQDHHAPSHTEIDKFVQFVRNLPPNTWLHFHCLAGKGRTTTFMAMYDILHNASQVTLTDIIQRQYLIGGLDLNNVEDRLAWKIPLKHERRQLLELFYNYARDPNGYAKQSWSEWLKTKNAKQFKQAA